MGSPAAGLAAFWAAGLAALFVEGLARGLAAFGAGFAGGLGGGSSPYGKQFALGTSHVKYNVPWAKTFAAPQGFGTTLSRHLSGTAEVCQPKRGFHHRAAQRLSH
jgi:hypothetical protein